MFNIKNGVKIKIPRSFLFFSKKEKRENVVLPKNFKIFRDTVNVNLPLPSDRLSNSFGIR